jgi:hypothetical protein
MRTLTGSLALTLALLPLAAHAAPAPALANYGFLTDFTCMDTAQARARIDQMLALGIREFQFYDWFADYETPTRGQQWPTPFTRNGQICKSTIATYIDAIHAGGGRAWAYVQSIGAESRNLASDSAGIFKLIDRNGTWYVHAGRFPTYFANAAWARHQVSIWGPAVRAFGFDGIHWDTLGPIAGDLGAETTGFHEFLATAEPALAKLGLAQTFNFVNLAWWTPAVARDLVEFPYAEVWNMSIEQDYYRRMAAPELAGRWGVMALYPSVDVPPGWTQTQVMIARYREAPRHRLRYLVLGDGQKRLVNEYFPGAIPLTADELAQIRQSGIP